MKEQAILGAIALVKELIRLIPQWVEAARAKGELSPEGEAAYQAHQAEVFSRPEAKPEQ